MAQDQIEEHKITNPTKEGYLEKQSSWFKTYRKRWMVLEGSILYSFKQEKQYDNPTEIFDLTIYNKVQPLDNETTGQFEILSSNDKRIFVASSENEMKEWMKCIINATNPVVDKPKPKPNTNPLMNEIDIAIRNRAVSTKIKDRDWSKLKTRSKSKSMCIKSKYVQSDDQKQNMNDSKHKNSLSSQMSISNSSKCSHFGCKCVKYIENISKWSKGKCKICNHTVKEHGTVVNKMDKLQSLQNEYSINYNFDEYVYTVSIKKSQYTINDLRNEIMKETSKDKNELVFMLDSDIVTDFNMDIVKYFKWSNTNSITFDVELIDNIEVDEKKNENVNNENDSTDECVVCMDNETTHICTPCGHFCICQDCIEAIKNKCPICRNDCKVIQVFK
eukprot:420171_1